MGALLLPLRQSYSGTDWSARSAANEQRAWAGVGRGGIPQKFTAREHAEKNLEPGLANQIHRRD